MHTEYELTNMLNELIVSAKTGDQLAKIRFQWLFDFIYQAHIESGKKFEHLFDDDGYTERYDFVAQAYNELIAMIDMLPDNQHRQQLKKKVTKLWDATEKKETAMYQYLKDPFYLKAQGYRYDWL